MNTMFTVDSTIDVAWRADESGLGAGGALRLLDHGAEEGRVARVAPWCRASQGEVLVDPEYCADWAVPGEGTLCAAPARSSKMSSFPLDRAPVATTRQYLGQEPGCPRAQTRGTEQR